MSSKAVKRISRTCHAVYESNVQQNTLSIVAIVQSDKPKPSFQPKCAERNATNDVEVVASR